MDDVHGRVPQKVVRPNQHLPYLPVTEENLDVKLEIKVDAENGSEEKTTSELALDRMSSGNHVVNETLELTLAPPSPARQANTRESDSVNTLDLSNDLKLSDTESIRSSKEENNYENTNEKPNTNDILTARLENCLIDMGGAKANVTVAKEMFKLAKNLDLKELQVFSV